MNAHDFRELYPFEAENTFDPLSMIVIILILALTTLLAFGKLLQK
jgi:hypothetical protein